MVVWPANTYCALIVPQRKSNPEDNVFVAMEKCWPWNKQDLVVFICALMGVQDTAQMDAEGRICQNEICRPTWNFVIPRPPRPRRGPPKLSPRQRPSRPPPPPWCKRRITAEKCGYHPPRQEWAVCPISHNLPRWCNKDQPIWSQCQFKTIRPPVRPQMIIGQQIRWGPGLRICINLHLIITIDLIINNNSNSLKINIIIMSGLRIHGRVQVADIIDVDYTRRFLMLFL